MTVVAVGTELLDVHEVMPLGRCREQIASWIGTPTRGDTAVQEVERLAHPAPGRVERKAEDVDALRRLVVGVAGVEERAVVGLANDEADVADGRDAGRG